MSLRHALLGLLAEKPASGFELTKAFDEHLSRWAWHASHSHIYPELRRMTEQGLIEVVEQASRGRKTYAVTPAGSAELQRWMLAPPTNELARNETALRLFLINTVDPESARTLLQRYIDSAEELLARINTRIESASDDWRSNPLAVGRLAAERGLRTLPAVRDWARWGIEQIDVREAGADADEGTQTPHEP